MARRVGGKAGRVAGTTSEQNVMGSHAYLKERSGPPHTSLTSWPSLSLGPPPLPAPPLLPPSAAEEEAAPVTIAAAAAASAEETPPPSRPSVTKKALAESAVVEDPWRTASGTDLLTSMGKPPSLWGCIRARSTLACRWGGRGGERRKVCSKAADRKWLPEFGA